jgi:two-component system, cell cycle sensor histidine kinase and response regulator CckA
LAAQLTMADSANSRDRQCLERALAESEARHQAVLQSSLDGIICTDQAGAITEFNGAAERIFRLPRSAALGKDLGTLALPEASRIRGQELLNATQSSGTELLASRLETMAMRSDGSEFPSELTVTHTVVHGVATFVVHVRDITARKRAEEALVWLAAIVESSQDAIIGTDLDGCIISWNRGAEVICGYTAGEVVGKHASVLVPPEQAASLSQRLEEIKSGRQIKGLETVMIAKNGGRIIVSLTISPVQDSAGTLIGVSALARDITGDKVVQESLRKANETSIYSSPVPIVAADVNSRVTVWNQAAAAAFGWSEHEVLGKLLPIIPVEETARAREMHKRLLSGEILTGVEVRRQKRDGSLLTISLSATPLWDEHRKVKGIIGFLTDITDRKRSEEALRRAEEKYRSIFENAVEGIYQATADGQYVSANPALARMLGFDSPEELMATRDDISHQEYVNPELRVDFIRSIEELEVVRHFEYQAHRRDGKLIWLSASAHAVRGKDGKLRYFEGTVQDVTERRELEQQLRQMQKIEAIGRLAGGVAHDFNNILMAISSYAELLGRKVADDATRRYVSEIVKATNRGSSLTQGLLTFGRKQVLSPRIFDLNSLVRQQLEMLKRLIPENVELKFIPCDAISSVKADPTQMEQVVMNLVINARDAMPDGGAVVIATETTALDLGDGGDQSAPGSRNYVLLSVRDSGCGMSAETKSHMFEPFFTTKEQGKGTGLGLATVFGIVKQSMGHIVVESQPGQGSTFKIYLPQTEGAAHSVQREEAIESVGGRETILLVEDDPAVREPAAEYLVECGYTVLKAGGGREALGIAKQRKEPIHLLLTDLVMPQMSGRELAEQIAALHPEASTIFMSGYSNNLLSNQQFLDPKRVLLQKPFQLTALGQCIRRALMRESAAGAGT